MKRTPLLLGGLLGLLMTANLAFAQSPQRRGAIAENAQAMAGFTQSMRIGLEYAPNGNFLTINARRLAESVEHVRNQAERGVPEADLARDFERVRMDFDYLRRDVETVYGRGGPQDVMRDWAGVAQTFQNLSRVMAQAR